MLHIFISIIFIFISIEPALAKICRKGIPCGNTCIASSKTCHVGRGSAIHESELLVQNTTNQISNTQLSNSKAEPTIKNNSGDTYNFRSYSNDYFLVESSTGNTLKCTPSCLDLLYLKRNAKIEFLDNKKIVEFEHTLGPRSCTVKSCTELKNDADKK